jgi:hypothetical protein
VLFSNIIPIKLAAHNSSSQSLLLIRTKTKIYTSTTYYKTQINVRISSNIMLLHSLYIPNLKVMLESIIMLVFQDSLDNFELFRIQTEDALYLNFKKN